MTGKPATNESDFQTITPNILYFGNPVAIVGSTNPDGTTNLAPISSFWELGWTMVLGLLSDTQTLDNLQREPDCVVNIPSPDLWEAVERLAPLTGKNPVPPEKAPKFHFESDKFAAAGFTPLASESVKVPRVKECPVQLEATVSKVHMLCGEPRIEKLSGGAAVEVRILNSTLFAAYYRNLAVTLVTGISALHEKHPATFSVNSNKKTHEKNSSHFCAGACRICGPGRGPGPNPAAKLCSERRHGKHDHVRIAGFA